MEPVAKRLRQDNNLSDEKKEKLEKVLGPLVLTNELINQIMDGMENQMHLANSPDEATRKKADLLMENTHVRYLLDGTENGTFLGLDLGGTNFRVVKVVFKDGKAETKTKYYTLTEVTLSGPADGVFDFIAESIKDFTELEGLLSSKEKVPLGFTFSFPCKMKSLNSSIMETWTKSFKCPDGPGRDPVKMLEEAIDRKAPGLPVEIVAVMSDTTSTLMAGNYLDKQCRIGLIVGTGCNAAFVEHLSNIEKWTGDQADPKHVIVNTEMGSLGDNGTLDFYKSEYEKEVDQYSNHPHSFTFEKSFSGHYLGELVRLVLMRLVKDGVLFGGQVSDLLSTRWKLTTTDVTMIECDKGTDTTNIRDVLKRFNLDSKATDEDIAVIRQVCSFLSRRGAFIVTSALAVLIRHVNLPEVTVAIDGSLYEHHPTFHDNMMELLGRFVPSSKVKLILAKDGSGQGAAFVAVSALRQREAGIRNC